MDVPIRAPSRTRRVPKGHPLLELLPVEVMLGPVHLQVLGAQLHHPIGGLVMVDPRAGIVDFVKGVATAITPMAFYETVMVKGYETLVDSETKVDVNTGMIAAGHLQSLIESTAGTLDMAQIVVQLDRVIEAVRSTVSREMWGRDRPEAGSGGAASRVA